MQKQEFKVLLNEIKSKEYSFRDIQTSKDINGNTIRSGPDVFKEQYNYVLCFLIYLKYKNIINFENLTTKEDLSNAISKYNGSKRTLVEEVWEELKDEYPYFGKLLPIIASVNFSDFNDEGHEKVLAEWGNALCRTSDWIIPVIDEIVCFNVIRNCQKQLGIDMENGDILLQTNIHDILTSYINDNPQKAHLYIYDSEYVLSSVKIALLLDIFSNISIIKEIDDKKFDGVISLNPSNIACKEWDSWAYNLKEGGFCLASGQKMEKLSDSFYKYDVPILFENEKYCILYRKVADSDRIVRYGRFHIDSIFDDESNWSKTLSESVKNSMTTFYYEEVKKEDFKYTREIQFERVRRKPDQRNFVWVKKADVIIQLFKESKWLWDTKLSDEKIINWNNLSKDPFRINATAELYIQPSYLQTNSYHHILEECKIIHDNPDHFSCDFNIPSKYVNVFRKSYNPLKSSDEEAKEFDKALCCRLLDRPALLFNETAILRVNATPEHPVCFRQYFFYFDEDCMGYSCNHHIKPIKIHPNYDENFIIYQLLNQRDPLNSSHILVAPSKEEQHTYFLNKRLDYIDQFKPIVDEMEQEVQKSIEESSAYITGVGFKNFRRFTNLPVLPLSGVNIFVGGNNAGKSSFVKGLILTLDNIKNYVADNYDNTLLNATFHFDANSYHDVHIGTFDRSYSYDAIEHQTGTNERTMTFIICCAHFEISIVVKPQHKNDITSVPIREITVIDNKRGATFSFNYEQLTTSARFAIGEEKIDYYRSGFTTPFRSDNIGKSQISMLIRGIVSETDSLPTINTDKEQLEKIRNKAGFILEIADELERIVHNTSIEYICAHGVNQKVLFNYNDKNDYMAQTLHDLMIEKISNNEEDFIRHWLKEFGLGTDYDVHSIGGEAYILQIKNFAGKMVYLADMGMGSNQLVILILRLAIIIHRQRILEKKPYRPTIIIEEPEQNMHPAFQSKLAALFFEVHQDYRFNFIVETHSEYMVRRSQVIVAKQKFKNEKELKAKCPFKVYYFPSDGQPYEMLYRKDGNFSTEFGKGFYDEANNLLFEII